MASISYGGFTFPHPTPLVSEDLSFIKLSGSLDHISNSISLIGEITGCDLTSVKLQKEAMVQALSSGYQNLTLGSTGYDYAKPLSINFASSDLRKRVPYEISFECYNDLGFSQFYGVQNPVDTWQFSEESDRIVSATHEVSAKGYKSNTGDTFNNARNFVNNRLNGFNNNLSLFFSGQTYILTAKNESIDRLNNSYGIVEEWSLSTSNSRLDVSGAIVRADCSVQYNGDSDLSVSIQGNIIGGISGAVTTGFFTLAQASEFAKNAVRRSKIPYEERLYGDILKDPLTYNYSVDSGANDISFSFAFVDPTDLRTGDIKHDYSTSINASKDSPFSSVSVDGSVVYNSTQNIFTTDTPETEERWKRVDSFFSGVNPYLIAQQHFSWFNSPVLPYNQNALNDVFSTANITKTPHSAQIDYSYSFSNKPDFFSGLLRNPDLTVSTSYPIPSYSISPTTDNSFAVQETYDRIERKDISLNATLVSGVSFNTAINFVNNWLLQYSGNGSVLLSDSLQTGSNTFSLTKSFATP